MTSSTASAAGEYLSFTLGHEHYGVDVSDQALREAVASDTAGVRGGRAERLAAVIERARRGEPVPAAPRDETANGAAR